MSSSLWQDSWPSVGASELVSLGLLCKHDLQMSASCCRLWRTVIVSSAPAAPCYCDRDAQASTERLVPGYCRPVPERWICTCDPRSFIAPQQEGHVQCAVARDSCHVVRWLLARDGRAADARFQRSVTTLAATCGSMRCLVMLRSELGFSWCTDATAGAARNGHEECLRWLVDNGCGLSLRYACEYAAEAQSSLCLEFVRQQGCVFGNCVMYTAWDCGSVGCFDYCLREFGSRVFTSFSSERLATGMARGGVDLLRVLEKHRLLRSPDICAAAAGAGLLECLQFAHEQGCSTTESTLSPLACERAAESGHLDCLRYAHENGFPWDARTCSLAAGNDHLDCLSYAHEHGCPWDTSTWDAAHASRCIAYCRRNQCPQGNPVVW